jgi:hypothetical protein
VIKRTVILSGLLLILSLAVLFAGGKGEAPAPAPEANPPETVEVTVTYLEGSVLVDGKEALFGQTLSPGTLIETGRDSLCELQFGGGNIMHIEEETLVRINIGKELHTLDLQRGGLQAVFNRLTEISAGEKFQLSSPTMVAGIRGTVFYLRVEDASNTYLCTCYGTIDQGPADGSTLVPVTGTHHKAYRYTRIGDEFKIESAALLYHDDATMEALARKIGTDIKWGEGGY